MDEIVGNKNYQIVYSSKESGFRIILSSNDLAKKAIIQINGSNKGRLTAQFGHPDSLLFVGNLPLSYTHSQLRDLFSSCGTILRCFVIHSTITGESKGYGFVEYSTRDEATATKNKMATKVVGYRSIRVDFADNGMQTDEDLQSKTVFVDKLPKGTKSESKLIELFSKYGMVNFCQVSECTCTCILQTVIPLNKGHIGTSHFIFLYEVVLVLRKSEHYERGNIMKRPL